MSTISIYTAGTLGDHLPFMALGQALTARGHRIRMAVNPAMALRARGAGLEVEELPEDRLDAAEARRHASAWNHWGPLPTGRRNPFSSEDLPLIRSLMALTRDADLLISTSIRPWGWLVHHATGVPWLTAAVTPADFWQPRAEPERRRFQAEGAAAGRRLRAWLAPLCDDLGIRLPGGVPRLSSRVVLASSRHFHDPGHPTLDALGCEVHPTGFWFYQDPARADWRPSSELLQFMERSPRPIVLSFSSLPVEDRRAVLDVHLRAAKRLGRPLLVQRGWAGFSRNDLSREHEEHDVAFTDFVPHDWLFARAACAIQHGGIGSIAQALRQGCPLLIEPYGNDQFFNAMRVVSLGVGAAMRPGSLSVDGLVQVLQGKVLTAGYRQRCAALGQAMRGDPGTQAACEHVERTLHRPNAGHGTSVHPRPPARDSPCLRTPRPVAQRLATERRTLQ